MGNRERSRIKGENQEFDLEHAQFEMFIRQPSEGVGYELE